MKLLHSILYFRLLENFIFPTFKPNEVLNANTAACKLRDPDAEQARVERLQEEEVRRTEERKKAEEDTMKVISFTTIVMHRIRKCEQPPSDFVESVCE